MSSCNLKFEDINSIVSKIGCQTYFARKKGKGHIESGKVCQDYCLVENLNDDVLVIAVADGHGGEAYDKSDIGAKIACETVVNSVKIILQSKSPSVLDNTWVEALKKKNFKSKYINLWKSEVLKDYKSNSENEREISEANIIKKYGTTILFAIVTSSYYVLGQLGDGAILMFNNDGQCQLFKRHAVKTDSQTSSLASGRAEYAFMIDFFRRELFGNILISTDGIYDRLDMENSFLIYAASLLEQIRENKNLDRPFEINGIDVSEISKDDCTIALMVSDSPTRKYELKLPPVCECRNVEFIRAYNGLEIYRAYDENDELEIHVVEGDSVLKKLDVKNCVIQYPKDTGALRQNRRMFLFVRPEGMVRMQELIERGEHLEKKYWFNDKDYMREEHYYIGNNSYSNQFWLEIYEKIMLIEKEFEIIKVYPLPAMFDTAYITINKKIFLFPDTLRQEGYEKDKLSLVFRDFYERFGIMGKLSCGKISIPLFRCSVQGQNINMLHAEDKNTSLCRVIYNKDKDMYGLFNLSGRIWNIDDGKRKEIAPHSVLRLKHSCSFSVKSAEHYLVSGAEVVDEYARYKVELF